MSDKELLALESKRLDWLNEHPDTVCAMACGGWAYIVAEYEEGYDTVYSKTFETIREAVDSAMEEL